MPAKLRRAPPYLILGLILSLLGHGAVAVLSYIPALARRLLPRLPIEMTILPPKPHPQAAPPVLAEPPKPPPTDKLKPGETGPKVTPGPRKPLAKRAPAAPAPPKIAALAGLGPSAIDRDIGVRVILRMAQLRSSPHRPALVQLLAAFPDTHILAHGTKLPSAEALAQLLVDKLQGVLIATPDPSDLTATAFYGTADDTGPVQAMLVGRQPLVWDPRQLSAPRRGLLAFARPDLLGPGTYKPRPPPAGAPPGDAAAQAPVAAEADWPEQLQAALLAPGPALSAEILNVQERVRLQGGLPTPTALRLAMSGEANPALILRLELRTPEEATRLAAVLPELQAKVSTYMFLLGLSGLLDDLKLATYGAAVELTGHLPAKQLDVLLGVLAQQLPPPERFLPPPPPPPPAPPVGPAPADAGTPDARPAL